MSRDQHDSAPDREPPPKNEPTGGVSAGSVRDVEDDDELRQLLIDEAVANGVSPTSPHRSDDDEPVDDESDDDHAHDRGGPAVPEPETDGGPEVTNTGLDEDPSAPSG